MLVRQGNWSFVVDSGGEEAELYVEAGDDGSCSIKTASNNFQNLNPEVAQLLAFFIYQKCYQKKPKIENFEVEVDTKREG